MTILAACLMMAGPAVASPGLGPGQTVEAALVRILSVVQDGRLDGMPVADRGAAIQEIARELVDFDEISRRALAHHWQARTPDERAEFVVLFRGLLERSYVSQLQAYAGEQISLVDEAVDGDVARVRTQLVTKRGREIGLDFRMHARDGRWQVYDVVVSGFSLVGSYRSQFDRVIQVESYGALCERLRKKSLDTAAGRGAEAS